MTSAPPRGSAEPRASIVGRCCDPRETGESPRRRSRDGPRLQMGRERADGPAHLEFGPQSRAGIRVGLRQSPGQYMPIGLPRDRVLASAMRYLAEERRVLDDASPEEGKKLTRDALAMLLDAPEDEVDELRRLIATVELQTAPHGFLPGDLRLGGDAEIEPVPLPGGLSLKEFRKRFANLEIPAGGLPEETLFFRPGSIRCPNRRGRFRSRCLNDGRASIRIFDWLRIRKHLLWPPRWLCWFFSRNWWTYHHDSQLTGVASGCSGIRRTTVCGLALQSSITLDGPVISIPCVVNGKIYVGTGNSSTAAGGSGGTLYKIDLSTGAIDDTFTFNTPMGQGSRQGYAGSAVRPPSRAAACTSRGWTASSTALTPRRWRRSG